MSIIDHFSTPTRSTIAFNGEVIIELNFTPSVFWTKNAIVECIVNDFRMTYDCPSFTKWCNDLEVDYDLQLFPEYYHSYCNMLILRENLTNEQLQELLEFYDPETPIKLV